MNRCRRGSARRRAAPRRATPAGGRRRTDDSCPSCSASAWRSFCVQSPSALHNASATASAVVDSPTAPRRSCRRRRWWRARGRCGRGCRRAWPATSSCASAAARARHEVGVPDDLQDRPAALRCRRPTDASSTAAIARRACGAVARQSVSPVSLHDVFSLTGGRRSTSPEARPGRRARCTIASSRAGRDEVQSAGRQRLDAPRRPQRLDLEPQVAGRCSSSAARLLLQSPRSGSRGAAARSAARPRTAAMHEHARPRRPTSTARAAAPRPPRGRSGCCGRPS